jgi:hypothetical protein
VQDWGCNAVADTLEDDRPSLAEMLADRRRSGRRDYESAHLTALLRDQPKIAPPATEAVDAVPKVQWTDDSAPARGILIGLPIGVAMWSAIIFAVWHFI